MREPLKTEERVVCTPRDRCVMRRYRWRGERAALRAICSVCRWSFSVHGAEHPHTRGEECGGFKDADEKAP